MLVEELLWHFHRNDGHLKKMMRSLLGVVCICAALVGQPLSGGATEGVNVSFNFRNVPLREVLGHFRTAHGYDVNLATYEWAEETVSAFIRNAPIQVALRRTLKCFNYTLVVADSGNRTLYITGRVHSSDGISPAEPGPLGTRQTELSGHMDEALRLRAKPVGGKSLIDGCAKGLFAPEADENDDDWFESDGRDRIVELNSVGSRTDVPGAGGSPHPGLTDSQGRVWVERDGPDGVVELVLVDPGTDVLGAGGSPHPGLRDSQGRVWVERDGPDGVVELVLVDPGTDVPGAGGSPYPGLTDSQDRVWVERDGPDGVVELVLVDPGTDVPSDGSPIE